MAVINLDSQTIQSLGAEISSLDASLINGQFPELESELVAIASNVQGDQLHSIINTINSQFSGVKSTLSTELPKLESFLEEQMKTYATTEAELDTELQAVLTKMALIAGEGPKNFGTQPNGTSGNGDKTADETTTADGTTKESNESNNSIWGNMLGGAAVGAGWGAAAGGTLGTIFGPPGTVGGYLGGAAIGAVCGALTPVATDLGGKLIQGTGWLLEQGGSALEKWAGDW